MILRQLEFLGNLESLRFTGQWIQAASGQELTFYLAQGRIVYATGGLHPIRRWRRNLITFCPYLPTYRLAWQVDLAKVTDEELGMGWEYALLKLWVTQQRITQTQAQQLIQATAVELLCDLMQAAPEGEQIQHSPASPLFFAPIELGSIASAAQVWQQRWQEAGLSAYSPHQAPVIRQPEAFQQWATAHSYQALVRLLNGQRTLRDLAVDLRRDWVDISRLMLHCVQLGFVELTTAPDLPGLVFQRKRSAAAGMAAGMAAGLAAGLAAGAPSKALIACIDDSLMVRKMMEELLTSAGYQFLGIEDPLRAIGILLAHKPDLIFLDLVMPNVNGYELCEKLRQLSCFRNTPIVMLTSNDRYTNRLRSNFAGATDFLGKPLNAEAVLGVIHKSLLALV